MVKAVIFDMDGVLIDSQPLHYETDTKCMEEQGITIPLKELQEGAGTPTRDRIAEWKEKYQIKKSLKELVARREELEYTIFSRPGLKPISGIPELLENLKNAGIQICVASSSSHRLIEQILTALHIQNYFEKRIGSEDVLKGKPHPEVFLLAAEKIGRKPEECVVIEDSKNGVLAANAAKMRVIGYQNVSSGQQDISSADLIIDDFCCLSVDDIQFLKKEGENG